MIVLHLVSCPVKLQGEITKWLFEVASGIYVGVVSARVRDELWEHICKECKHGRAVLVYPTNTEQRFDFRVHGESWLPVDFDGLKLMLRPSLTYMETVNKTGTQVKLGFSKAAKRRAAKRFSK